MENGKWKMENGILIEPTLCVNSVLSSELTTTEYSRLSLRPGVCIRPYLDGSHCSVHIQDIPNSIRSATPITTAPKQHRNTETKRHKQCDSDYLQLCVVVVCVFPTDVDSLTAI